MRDLIERLRKWNIHDDGTLDGGRVMRDMRKAADDIERLSAELFAAELRAKTYEEGYDESQEAVRYFQAKVKALEGVLDRLARLGNEPHYGNSDGNVIAQKALAATEQEGEWLEPGKCSHNWFRPDDTDNLKWGEYRLCRACHAIGIPATEHEG